ncbi:MAG: nucleotidyltransferase domain-containing protein [Myxococcales bacterium]|nr:nucleotidyltransferase domain-containing protein [Myxococcales bacterium]
MAVTAAEMARALVERQRRKREAHAHRAAELRARLADWAASAVRAGIIRRAWLIGSLAWGSHGEGSDVDLVVEGLGVERETQTWVELCDLVQGSVDLLRIEELPESFARRAQAEGVPLP